MRCSMKKITILLIFAVLVLFLMSACSKQITDTVAAQDSNVGQQTQEQTKQPTQEPNPLPTSAEKETTNPQTQSQETQQAPSAQQVPEVKEFKMTAKQFSFDPATIEVNKGDKVRLIVTSMDIPHGIAIREYGINQRIDVGKPATIEFTADKNGEFVAYCSVACGAGHGNMKGKLIVH